MLKIQRRKKLQSPWLFPRNTKEVAEGWGGDETPALQMTWVMVAQGTLLVGVPSSAGSGECREPQWWVPTGVTGKSESPACLALLSPPSKDLVEEYTFSLGKRMLVDA